MTDEPYQITERGDPRDRIANQRDTAPAIVCPACLCPMTPQSLAALGASYSCPCGRTTYTTLNDGELDLGGP